MYTEMDFLQYLASEFSWSNPYLAINRGDLVEWYWSSPITNAKDAVVFKVEQVKDALSTKRNGFSSGAPSSNGELYIYSFKRVPHGF